MNTRWSYKVVEIPVKLFGGKLTENVQAELYSLGAQGWELVSVVQTSAVDSVRLYLKKGS